MCISYLCVFISYRGKENLGVTHTELAPRWGALSTMSVPGNGGWGGGWAGLGWKMRRSLGHHGGPEARRHRRLEGVSTDRSHPGATLRPKMGEAGHQKARQQMMKTNLRIYGDAKTSLPGHHWPLPRRHHPRACAHVPRGQTDITPLPWQRPPREGLEPELPLICQV